MTSPATTRTARPDSLTLDEALERARSIGQQVLAEAPDTERKSSSPEALHAQFLDAGFYHLLRPKTWGGYESTLLTF